MDRFRDRSHAGTDLARRLERYENDDEVVVLGLARGGVPVALEVAEELGAPLDVFTVRKLGVPGREELAMGAIATGGIRVLNQEVLKSLPLSDEDMARVAAQEQETLERRERAYRGEEREVELAGKTVILVDDGVATGASMKAAIQAIREREPERIVVGVPVGPPSTCQELEELADDVVCVATPAPLRGIGAWYEDFHQTDDDEVKACLARARDRA